MSLKKQATDIFTSTLKNVNPRDFLPDIIQWDSVNKTLLIYDQHFHLHGGQKLFVIGTGKASPTMAEACETIIGDDLSGGLIIAPPGSKKSPGKIYMHEGSHPLPDEKSFQASGELLSFIETIPNESVVINLLSGGTSALLCFPADDISIPDLQTVFRLLLESGASIHEVNTVRKSISKVKGGRLLGKLKHTTLLDLVISDVPDDDLRFIGSGPTTAQNISYTEAKSIAEKYEIWDKLPEPVIRQIHKKIKSDREIQTPDFKNHYSWIVSSAKKVAGRTADLLESEGFKTQLIHPAWTGLIDDFEEKIVEKIESGILREKRKQALVFYGECTVKVTGVGLGGRNQELALRMAKRLSSYHQNITFLSAGTDGIDGPTDAAGAVVDQNTWNRAMKEGTDPELFIRKNDSYHFFKKCGGHIITGPTGNNVMDIQIVLTD